MPPLIIHLKLPHGANALLAQLHMSEAGPNNICHANNHAPDFVCVYATTCVMIHVNKCDTTLKSKNHNISLT